MYILGLSCFYHDAAAALIKDGIVIAATEEERFSRKKHDFGFPEKAINFCLEFAGISFNDIDFVVFHEKPFLKFERILKTIISTYPQSASVFAEAMKNWLAEKLWIKHIIRQKMEIDIDKILFTEHHLSHAASTFFVSPYEEAAILTIDGVGEWATGALGTGIKNKINLFKQINFPNSLGLLYSTFTAFLGFEVNEGEYKVMGMAAYGKPLFKEKILQNILNLHNDGSFELNMDYFSFHYSLNRSYSKKFVQLFGKPRATNADFFTKGFEYPSYFEEKPDNYNEICTENQFYADIAASVQAVTEEIIIKQAVYLHKHTGMKNLCLAGGVALNSAANGRLLREGPFENIFIQPAPGDSGAAIGAALYVYHQALAQKRDFILEHAYLGKEYTDEQILSFLNESSIPFRQFKTEDELIDYCVQAIEQSKVIGWFQGRSEWGPRALGNRSIIADARNKDMKNIVNLKIKFREPFRPFAPVIKESEIENYFEVKNKNQYPFRYMLMVLGIKEEKRKLIPAVDHEGTGRVQTITKEGNPRYYKLVEKFAKKTGIPLLLNTSFNLKGEPIVNSPINAYNTFINTGLDLLVLGNFIIEKNKNKDIT
ncbi:MAG: carbamoyltransferase [Candidatus Omnitrophica bacterium]|nr:carbamoyltransferase [Candidatus Omnitrophota bacterium]